MANEGFFDEWDDDFIDKLVQAEELAMSVATQKPSRPPPLPPPPQPQSSAMPSSDVSYSPPRELSQRVPDYPKGFNGSSDVHVTIPPRRPHTSKEQEIERLKKELDQITKQRTLLEQECIELRTERAKKEKELNSKSVNVNTDSGIHIHIHGGQVNAIEDQNAHRMNGHTGSMTKVGKDVGIQTENSIESDLSTTFCRRNQLLDAWNLSSGQRLGGLLISKLYTSCEVDFRVLSGFMNLNFPSRTSVESNIPLQYIHAGESAKVSHLFSVLTKITDELVKLEELLEALVGLCRLKNVAIIYRSLHILQEVLSFTFNMERKFGERDNIVVEEPVCSSSVSGMSEYEYVGTRGLQNFGAETIIDQDHVNDLRLGTSAQVGSVNYGSSSCLISPCFNYVPLLELMCKIVMENDVENVKLSAVSVMTLIVTRSNAYLEREKYGTDILFQSITKLLKKGTQVHIKKKTVHLLHMLLNCPRVMASFCSCFMEGDGGDSDMADANSNKISTFSVVSVIFENLAECFTCTESNAEELELRRHTIILLAFFASSGKCGIEILLNYQLPKGSDFLATILRSLVCDMDLEESDTTQQPEVFKERTLLIREVLILLNRLVSHPKYSSHALWALTKSQEKASLTVDLTSRLSSKRKFLWQDVSMTRQIRESEIIDLAQVLRRRVFTFLGGSGQ